LLRALIGLSCVLGLTISGAGFWLHRHLDSVPPDVPAVDPYAALFDLRPLTVTITAATERVLWPTTVHDVYTDVTLWRRMHLADWNPMPEEVRENHVRSGEKRARSKTRNGLG
jgi:hypothetical protein